MRVLLLLVKSNQPLPLAPSPSDGEGGTGGEVGMRACPLSLPPLHWMERGNGGEVCRLLDWLAAEQLVAKIWLPLRRAGTECPGLATKSPSWTNPPVPYCLA